MSERSTVHVSGISAGTTEKEVQDFFSFWYAQQGPIRRQVAKWLSIVERLLLSL